MWKAATVAVKDRNAQEQGEAYGDFRAAPMPSPEGHGAAKSKLQRAWKAYADAIGPFVEPAARVLGREMTFDLLGFWLTWHLHGGFEGMQRDLKMSRSAVYRRVSAFRRATGQHPDDFRLPGVSFNVKAYLAGTPKIATVQDRGTVAE